MTILSYPINTVAFQPVLSNGLPTELTLYNLSASVTININDSTQGNGFPLSPGASITWDPNKPLYAGCASTATLVVLDNGGQVNDPSILAQLIVDSGLAQDIADNISISGAPSIDIFDEVMLDDNFVQGAAAPHSSPVMGPLNKYGSIDIKVGEINSVATTVPTPRRYNLLWFRTLADAQAGTNPVNDPNAVDIDTFWSTDTNAAAGDIGDVYSVFTTFVKAPYAVLWEYGNGIARGVGLCVLRATARYRSVQGASYQHISGHGPNPAANTRIDDDYAGLQFRQWTTKTAGTALNDYPSFTMGNAKFVFEVTACTVAGQIFIFDVITGVVFKTIQVAVNAGIVSYEFETIANTHILAVSFSSAMAAGLTRYTLTQIPY